MHASLRVRLLAVTAAAVGLGLAFSCADNTGMTDGDADVDADTDADNDADIDIDGDADGDSDGDVGPDPTRFGLVALTETQDSVDVYRSTATPSFWSAGAELPACAVTRQAFGAECVIITANNPVCTPECTDGTVCRWADDFCADMSCVADTGTPQNAGDVTINGATHQGAITCIFNALLGTYACDVDGAANFWEAADTLTVAGTGGDFPAFTTSVTAAADLALVSDVGTWTADYLTGDEDLLVTWMPGTGAVTITVTPTGGAETPILTCETADDGSMPIPAAGLAAIAVHAATGWWITVNRTVSTTASAGSDGSVTVTTTGTGVSHNVVR